MLARMSGLSRSDIDDILRLLEQSSFDELRLEIGDTKIELRRRGAAPAPQPAATASPAAAPSPAPASPAPTVRTAPASDPSLGTEVPSPLLGTYYRAPKPGADPFVEVGDLVDADTVIGIVEVMKLMNPVTAGVAGVVTEIVAANGQLVEHGQTLLRVRPT